MNRVEWIDVVKYICIIFVMLTHLETKTELLETFYTPFFLNAFFFVSGYVYSGKGNFKEVMLKKSRQLLIPWFFLSVFNILLSHIFSFNEHKSLVVELMWNFYQIRGKGDGLWFISALYVSFIPFYFLIKLYEKKGKRIYVVGISLCLSLISVLYTIFFPDDFFVWGSNALPWHIEYIFQAAFYMMLGYAFKTKYESFFDKYNKLYFRVALAILYIVICYVPYIYKFTMPVAVDLLYTYACQVCGIAVVISFAKKIKSNAYMLYVGQNTLLYFAFHGKAYSIIQVFLRNFVGAFYKMVSSNIYISAVFSIVFALVLSVILIIPTYVVNRWFPFLVGRKYHSQPKD